MKRDTPKYIKELARELRKDQTEAESIIWKYIRGSKLNGYKFRRQYAIGRYIADFYCCEARLAIEIDGKIHELGDRKEYDQVRQIEIEARNIKVLRFRNEDIFNRLDCVLQSIIEVLTPLPSSGEG